MSTATKQSTKSKVRIRLESFDIGQVDAAARQMSEIIQQSGADISGPIPLPTKKKSYCVNSSTHVDKRSGEHFEVRIHVRIIDIVSLTNETMASLQKISLPAGVGVKLQVMGDVS